MLACMPACNTDRTRARLTRWRWLRFPDEFKPNTKQEVLDFLRFNYYRHFNENRAPFGIFLHARWFDDFPFAFTV